MEHANGRRTHGGEHLASLPAPGWRPRPVAMRPRLTAAGLLRLVWPAAAQGHLHVIGTKQHPRSRSPASCARAPPTAPSSRASLGLLLPGRPRRRGSSPMARRPWRPRRSGVAPGRSRLEPCSAGPSAGPARPYYDSLTGLANEELLTRRVAPPWPRAARAARPSTPAARAARRGCAAGGPLTEQALDELVVACRLSGAVRAWTPGPARRALRGAGRGPRRSRPGGPAGRARRFRARPVPGDRRSRARPASGHRAGGGLRRRRVGGELWLERGRRGRVRAHRARGGAHQALTAGASLGTSRCSDLRAVYPEAVEALLRWQHLQRGELPAAEFLPAAESSDLHLEIGMGPRRAAPSAGAARSGPDGGGSGSA